MGEIAELAISTDTARLKDFNVTVIGAGIGGLNVAAQLKRAGIPWTLLEKNFGVGRAWFENPYPMAVTGQSGRKLDEVWAENGARALS